MFRNKLHLIPFAVIGLVTISAFGFHALELREGAVKLTNLSDDPLHVERVALYLNADRFQCSDISTAYANTVVSKKQLLRELRSLEAHSPGKPGRGVTTESQYQLVVITDKQRLDFRLSSRSDSKSVYVMLGRLKETKHDLAFTNQGQFRSRSFADWLNMSVDKKVVKAFSDSPSCEDTER